jgi:hypothetical protein
MQREPEVIGRHEGVAAKVEPNQVIASVHLRTLDLYEDRLR